MTGSWMLEWRDPSTVVGQPDLALGLRCADRGDAVAAAARIARDSAVAHGEFRVTFSDGLGRSRSTVVTDLRSLGLWAAGEALPRPLSASVWEANEAAALEAGAAADALVAGVRSAWRSGRVTAGDAARLIRDARRLVDPADDDG